MIRGVASKRPSSHSSPVPLDPSQHGIRDSSRWFVLTVIALALVMLLGATYWRWLGYV
jgi:hypothetical protein